MDTNGYKTNLVEVMLGSKSKGNRGNERLHSDIDGNFES